MTNTLDSEGFAPLHRAVMDENAPQVQSLIKAGARVDVQDKNGDTSLLWAARLSNLVIAKMLIAAIKAKTDLNIGNKNGDTALHEAMNRENLEIMEALIGAGADVDVANAQGFTPLHWAVAEWINSLEIAEMLLKEGADVNAVSKDGRTPLDMTKSEDNEAMITMLRRYNGKHAKEL